MLSFIIAAFARMLIILQLFHYTHSTVFTAVCKVEILAKAEVKMAEALKKYVQSVNEEGLEAPYEVQRFLVEMQEKVRVSSQERYAENPINAFHLVQRLYYKWDRMTKLIFCDQCPETNASKVYNSTMETIAKQTRLFASKEDLQGVAVALVRLWHTYKLDIDKLIRGQILDTKTDPLTPSDILYISEVADANNQTYGTILWLQALLKALAAGKTEQADDVKEVNIVLRLAEAYSSYGMPWESIKHLVQYQRKDPHDKGIARNITYFKLKLSSIPEEHRTKTLQPPTLDPQKGRYEALCRGEGKRVHYDYQLIVLDNMRKVHDICPIKSQRILSSLKCFSRQTKIPIYRVKEEVLNYAPRLSLFYEVIFDSEAKDLKEASFPLSANYDRMSEKGLPAILRVIVDGILWHRELNDFGKVLNYGIGGMYEPHRDSLEDFLPGLDRMGINPKYIQGSGDRVATWLFYLEDVKAGGATAFVAINVTVPVVKGAAAFWYNIKRNGKVDKNTWHAGCPVLLGSKWISNKWIRENGQLFRRPCGRSPNSQDDPL